MTGKWPSHDVTVTFGVTVCTIRWMKARSCLHCSRTFLFSLTPLQDCFPDVVNVCHRHSIPEPSMTTSSPASQNGTVTPGPSLPVTVIHQNGPSLSAHLPMANHSSASACSHSCLGASTGIGSTRLAASFGLALGSFLHNRRWKESKLFRIIARRLSCRLPKTHDHETELITGTDASLWTPLSVLILPSLPLPTIPCTKTVFTYARHEHRTIQTFAQESRKLSCISYSVRHHKVNLFFYKKCKRSEKKKEKGQKPEKKESKTHHYSPFLIMYLSEFTISIMHLSPLFNHVVIINHVVRIRRSLVCLYVYIHIYIYIYWPSVSSTLLT